MKYISEKDLENYFRSYDNADIIICGCGCKTEFDVPHGIIQRIEKDLKRKLREAKQSPEEEDNGKSKM